MTNTIKINKENLKLKSFILTLFVFGLFLSSTYSQKSSFSFIPQNGPDGSQANIQTYYDSIQNPDTKKIISVNYRKNKGENLASLLCVVTRPGTVFNHTKSITERFAKSTLTVINNVEVNGNTFPVSQLTAQEGTIEYLINFNIYKVDNIYYLNNNWYQTKNDVLGNNDVLNIQLSSSSMDVLTQLTESLITILSNEAQVNFTNDTPVYPQVFVKNGFYKSGFFYLNLDNKVKANSFYVKGSYNNSITGLAEKLDYLIVLDSNNISQIAVPADDFSEIEFTLSNGTATGEDFIYFSTNPENNNYSTAGTDSPNQSNTSIDNSKEIRLLANYPNPVISSTNISFELSKPTDINLSIYDITGNKITTLADGQFSAGIKTINFNASDLSTGIYFIKLVSAGTVLTKKIIKN